MDVIYKTTVNRCESREVFPDMIQSNTEHLPLWLQISGIIGWESITIKIIQNRHQLRHYNEGLTLCAYAINYLEGNRENKLSYIILENGMDCIKSLNELFLDANIEFEPNFKEFVKYILNGGLYLCKENIKESLQNEGLLSIP